MEDDHERRPDGVQRPERRDEVGQTRVRKGEGELDVGLVDGALRAGHEVDAPAPRHDARGEPCLDEGGVLAGRTPTPERAGLRVHEHWGDGGRRGGRYKSTRSHSILGSRQEEIRGMGCAVQTSLAESSRRWCEDAV